MVQQQHDEVVIYRDRAREWRWRRVSAGNRRVIADSGEGYIDPGDCKDTAMRVNARPFTLVIEPDDGMVLRQPDCDPAEPAGE